MARDPVKALARFRKWYLNNKEVHHARCKTYYAKQKACGESFYLKNLARKWRISVEEYQRQLAAQNGACAICLKPPRRGRLHVDHCHTTGKLRGFLCTGCNTFLGRVDDSPQRLEYAANYLRSCGVWGAS